MDAETAETVTTSPLAPLLGYWQQLDDGRRDADFAPGGHDLGLVAIRPTQRSLQVYRAWGQPPQLVVAAELRATFTPDGGVRLEETPSRPSRFFTSALPLPGMPGRSATPAARPLPCEGRWSIEQDGLLRLDGSLYRRVDRETFDRATSARAASPVVAPAPGAPGAGPARAAEPAGGVDFFGARVRGGFVCFICDISGSMSGDKMEALRREIIRTVRALPAGTNWQVVFFDDSAHVLRKGWVQAGTADSETLLGKVDGVGTGGGTDPRSALTFAFTQLDPVPHELFLLTDGNFDPDARRLLLQLNGGADRTRIHTLGMGSDAEVGALQAIAQDHGGTFTHIAAQSAPLLPGPRPPGRSP
ncbi:MAG: VWA domain-containing protein [Planctomycetes bacterium]|nr:VWA domain-containing protein [Planctomycetota bacterium]